MNGPLVQAGSINGDVTIQVPRSDHRLQEALASATVPLGRGKGVVVAPDLVLTCAEIADELGLSMQRWGPALALTEVELGEHPAACLATDVPAQEGALLRLSNDAGAPVLNRRTGAVCGVYDGDSMIEIPPITDDIARAQRANHAWLDLLDTDQLREGGWRHADERLRQYLRTIGTADREHSYRFLCPRVPPLSTIYVARTAVRNRRTTDGTEGTEAELLRADELLHRHHGAQIVDAPGMGKSSLVRRLTANAARSWLEHDGEKFVPVLVPAYSLALPEPLPNALAKGVSRWFSPSLAHHDLVDLFNDEPIAGVPWLIFVDGLDEIAGRTERNTVLEKIKEHRTRGRYRFLITCRRFTDTDVRRIEQVRFPTYRIQPFSDADLERFAERFLSAQDKATAGTAADFMTHVRRTRMLDLAKVPLTATMLCTLYADQPTAELPENHAHLYSEFLEWARLKRNDPAVRSMLRVSIAGGGPATASAVDSVMDDLDELLKHLALQLQEADSRTERPSLLEIATRWSDPYKPRGVSASEWTELLSDALRQSGLLIQTGSDEFEFMHKTLEEYLAARAIVSRHPAPKGRAARKLMSTRSAWPSRRVKTFLVAQWLANEADLSRYLRRTLRGWRWRDNVDFMVELVQHGVNLPDERVQRRVERLLCREVSRSKTSAVEWRDAVRQLEVINRGLAVQELERLADRDRTAEGRCLEAVQELTVRAAPNARQWAEAFLTHDETEPRSRAVLVETLAQHDRKLAVSVLSEIADGNASEPRRLEAAVQLKPVDVDSCANALNRLVGDRKLSIPTRISAVRELLDTALETGIVQLSAMLLEVNVPRPWQEIADLFEEYDADGARSILTMIASKNDTLPDRPHAAASMLVDRFGVGHDRLLDIARDHRLGTSLQIKSVARVGDRDPQIATEVLLDVLSRVAPANPHRVDALEALLPIDPETAHEMLTALAEEDQVSFESQVRAIKLGAGRTAWERGELCVRIACSRGNFRPRLEAANLAAESLHPRWNKAFRSMVESGSLSEQQRIDTAKEARRHDFTFCGVLIEILVRDRSMSPARSEQAAEELRQHDFGRFRQVSLDLVGDPSYSRSQRARAANDGALRSTAVSLLLSIASGRSDGRTRLEAAHVLSLLDRAKAIDAFRQIENGRRAGARVKHEAREEADRLERR